MGDERREEQSRIRVVLAEDHHVVRTALIRLLRGEPGIEVVGEVATGGELFAIVKATKPDLLVMDAEMPDHYPVEAVKLLRRQYPKLKILVLSAHNSSDYVMGLLEAGVDGYLLKNDPRGDLVAVIRLLAEGGQWISPATRTVLVRSLRASGRSDAAELSPREREILLLLARGYSNKKIASSLALSEHTVRNYVADIFNALGVSNRVEAVVAALSQGLITLDSLGE